VLRAGVAARARLTVAFECLAIVLPFLLLFLMDRWVLTFRFRAAECLRADFSDRLAALLGRFVFTPPP
jgi:hypothetical protein